MKRAKKTAATPEPEPKTLTKEGFSTWRTPNPNQSYGMNLGEEPSTFNGYVNAYRYRITVERIEESQEVIVARMVEMYRTTTNMHTRDALHKEAGRIGVDLRAAIEAAK